MGFCRVVDMLTRGSCTEDFESACCWPSDPNSSTSPARSLGFRAVCALDGLEVSSSCSESGRGRLLELSPLSSVLKLPRRMSIALLLLLDDWIDFTKLELKWKAIVLPSTTNSPTLPRTIRPLASPFRSFFPIKAIKAPRVLVAWSFGIPPASLPTTDMLRSTDGVNSAGGGRRHIAPKLLIKWSESKNTGVMGSKSRTNENFPSVGMDTPRRALICFSTIKPIATQTLLREDPRRVS